MPGVVEIGDKIHIMTRRFFEDDVRRHFLGEVIGTSESLVEARGYTFIFQHGTNDYRRLPEQRTRIFYLGDAGHVVNKIPRDVELGAVSYRMVQNRLVISDDRGFALPINEFSAAR